MRHLVRQHGVRRSYFPTFNIFADLSDATLGIYHREALHTTDDGEPRARLRTMDDIL